MSARRPGSDGAPRAPSLIAVAVVCAAAAGGLSYAALAGGDDDRDGPAAVVSEQTGPFRGGTLPPELAGAPAPQFAHEDAYGRRISTAELAGAPYVVTFLYTDCPDVCPLIAQELRSALELLGERGREVTVLAVSVDPEGDTPAAVRAWLARNDLPPTFRYLVGNEDELRPTWSAYFAAPQPNDDLASAHTASVWLVDAAGRLRTKFSGGAPVAPADIAHDLDLLLDDARRRARTGPD